MIHKKGVVVCKLRSYRPAHQKSVRDRSSHRTLLITDSTRHCRLLSTNSTPCGDPFFVSATKPTDAPFKFFPRWCNHRVGSATVPVFMTFSAPVPHKFKVIEFFAKQAVRLGRVVNVERSFLRTTAFAPNGAISPRGSSPHRSPNLSPVIALQVSLIVFSPCHESAFRVETATLKYLCRPLKEIEGRDAKKRSRGTTLRLFSR
jgi:hypothetical protein